jgi:hypothetical protein
MADGSTEPIKDIKPGQKVKATDPGTGKTTNRPVEKLITTKDDKNFATLTIQSSKANRSSTLVATVTHPFWVASLGSWIDAGHLKPGMTLRTANGGTAVLRGIKIWHRQHLTHDLTVGTTHTYYVFAGVTPVLVHNCDIPFGFTNLDDYDEFVGTLKSGLSDAGYSNTEAVFHGSSVTGARFRDGTPFGDHSDYDVALAGSDIFDRVKSLGVALRSRGTRTGPLKDPRILQQLGLSGLRQQLSEMAGRDVNFMIYDSLESATSRGPSIRVNCGC